MPNEFTIKASFQDLTDLKDGLEALREKQYVSANVEHLVKYDWALGDTERTLQKRARIANTLKRLFDVEADTTVDHEAVKTIAEAKRQKADLEALEALENADA